MVEFLSLVGWILQQQSLTKRTHGQLLVHGQWRDAEIVDFGPPIKIVLKGEPGCILASQQEFDTFWRFEGTGA